MPSIENQSKSSKQANMLQVIKAFKNLLDSDTKIYEEVKP